MALLTWSRKYSVGVQALDGQHTVLFDILNELHEAMLKGQAQSLTGALLGKLLEYTRTHFSAEEAMLADSEYPDLTEHQRKHRDLIEKVEEYAARYGKGEVKLNIQLLNFVRDWLTNHIQRVDKEYESWLNEHGVC